MKNTENIKLLKIHRIIKIHRIKISENQKYKEERS